MTEDSKDGKENSSDLIFIANPSTCSDLIIFSEGGGEVLIRCSGDEVVVEGATEKGAKDFFEGFFKPMADGYIAEKLKNVEKAKELCRKYAKATEVWDEFIEHKFVKMPLIAKGFVNHIGQEILGVLENGTE